VKVGIDVGYGYLKVVDDSYQCSKFPSVATKAVEFPGLEANYGRYLFEYDGQRHFIGNAAHNARTKYLRTAYEKDRLNSEVYKHLFLCGIGSAMKRDGSVEVVAGLPVNYFKTNREDIEKFQGIHKMKINGVDLEIDITRIRCVPQPYGSYVKLLENNPEMKDQLVLICDIGFRTSDFLLVDHNRVLPQSLSIDFGWGDAAKEIVGWVNEHTDVTYNLNQVDKLLENGYVYRGNKMAVDPAFVDATQEELFDNIWNRLKEEFQDYSTFEQIVFTGGTTERLKPYIEGIKMGSVTTGTDLQYANVIGFRKILDVML